MTPILLLRRTLTTQTSSIRSLGHKRLLTTTTSGSTTRSSSRRTVIALSAAIATSATAYTFGSIYPPQSLSVLFPRTAPAPPLDAASPESVAYVQSLESKLQSLQPLQALRSQADHDQWYELRPYQKYPEERRVNSLTAGALRGPGKLALAPLVRAKNDESESVAFVHLGRGLCGHDGIVHGGLLATLLDETIGRTAISNLPDKVGVTANLSLDYKAPTRADQFVVIKTAVLEAKGRKCKVSGRIEDLQGTILVDATATFVQPRYAKLLNTAALKQAMGEPTTPETPVRLADGENLKLISK